MDKMERRSHQRNPVRTEVDVNDGRPYHGGILRDLSLRGVSVIYRSETDPAGEPLKIGQTLGLNFAGNTRLPTRVVRIFDGGFAGAFDFTLDFSGDRLSSV